MSAPSPAPVPSRSRLKILLTAVGAILLAALLAAGGAAAWSYRVTHVCLPQVDGVVRVPGLQHPVTVIRDAQGVPHIRAGNFSDLLFAQGYVTAQDRLWQMDISRRSAAGDLSEVLGPGALEHDRRQRTLLLRQTAERITTSLDEKHKSYLDAYVRGVNAFIESHRGRLPIEFRLLHYQPQPWTPADTMLIGLQMSELLNAGDGSSPLSRERILAKLTPELAADLYPEKSWHDHWPGQPPPQEDEEPGDDDEAPAETQRARTLALPQPHIEDNEEAPRAGSNNWVISGAHTVSGKPLLSNDTHLPLGIPDVWYEAHLEAETGPSGASFDVAGFTLPGTPLVIIGHNRRIAWGFTNVGAAVTDLYLETFNDRGEYQTPEGWKKPEIRREEIAVKGRSPVAIAVVITRHGPIVSDLLPGETRKLALKWVVYEPGISLMPFDEVDAAQNWKEFLRALAHFDSPSQNVVYADIDGHIGYHATGKIPVRPPGTALVPLQGNDDTHEWTGFVPFHKLPSAYDPASGIIATANNRIVPRKYPYTLTADWEAPYRAERILRVLQSGKKFAASDMLELQMDTMSEFDHFCAERFVYAVDHAHNPSSRARAAADLMRSWDGHMKADAAAPVIETRARHELWHLLLEPKLGSDWNRYHWGLSALALENVLLHQPERWLPKGYENYDELLTAAVEQAFKQTATPDELSRWRWGRENPLHVEHPIFARLPGLDKLSGPGDREQSGSSLTVKAVQRTHGPSERMTLDLSDLDQSTMNLVTGESGQIFSPHYMDQFAAWFVGQTFTAPFSGAAMGRARKHELVLQPQ